MAENDSSIAIGLVLDMENLRNQAQEAQAVLQKMTTEFKKQGTASGKVYVEGVGEGVAELNKKLNKFVDSMGSISPKMGKLGEKIASGFSNPIFSMLPKISVAFSTMLPVIALIGAAIAVVVKAFSGAVKAQKEFSDNVKKSKEAQAFGHMQTPAATDVFRCVIPYPVKGYQYPYALT
jgi:phage-related protein